MHAAALVKSIENNDLAALQALLGQHPTLAKRPDGEGLAALDRAVDLGRHEAARLLLQAGADPNRRPPAQCGEPPLMAAIIAKDAAMAELLLEHQADCNIRDHYDYAPIQRAIMSHDPTMVRLLLGYGVELHFDTGPREGLVESSLSFSSDEITLVLLRAGALYKPQPKQLRELLTRAIERGMEHSARALLRMGAPWEMPNHKRQSCMQEACEAGSLAIALCLVEQGADPQAAEPGYDWLERAGSDAVRQWRKSLANGCALETTTAPVGAAAHNRRL